ncbi:MAG: hypothetical protein K1X57_21080 [Gemmataceae bacterium]|nr:hypothetical protein [Gemmataceae bacterium]
MSQQPAEPSRSSDESPSPSVFLIAVLSAIFLVIWLLSISGTDRKKEAQRRLDQHQAWIEQQERRLSPMNEHEKRRRAVEMIGW